MQLKTFIKKPVLSSVISILIVIVGIMALVSLPIEQYPDIAPPTVSVSTSYYGASAQTIQKSVIIPSCPIKRHTTLILGSGARWLKGAIAENEGGYSSC